MREVEVRQALSAETRATDVASNFFHLSAPLASPTALGQRSPEVWAEHGTPSSSRQSTARFGSSPSEASAASRHPSPDSCMSFGGSDAGDRMVRAPSKDAELNGAVVVSPVVSCTVRPSSPTPVASERRGAALRSHSRLPTYPLTRPCGMGGAPAAAAGVTASLVLSAHGLLAGLNQSISSLQAIVGQLTVHSPLEGAGPAIRDPAAEADELRTAMHSINCRLAAIAESQARLEAGASRGAAATPASAPTLGKPALVRAPSRTMRQISEAAAPVRRSVMGIPGAGLPMPVAPARSLQRPRSGSSCGDGSRSDTGGDAKGQDKRLLCDRPECKSERESDPGQTSQEYRQSSGEAPSRRASGRFRVDDDASVRGNSRSHTRRVSRAIGSSLWLMFADSISCRSGLRAFRHIVMSPRYEFLISMVVVANAVYLGVEAEQAADGPADPFTGANLVFNVIFATDILLRIAVCGRGFFTNKNWRWNWLDAGLVFFCLGADTWLAVSDEALGGVSAGSVVRGVRIVRLARSIRLLRTLKATTEFQKMAFALLSSARTLVCSLMILFFVIYIFGIIFCQAAGEVKFAGGLDVSVAEPLDKYYGSLLRCLMTLFMSITSGVSWIEVVTPLLELDPAYPALFLLYVAIVVFGVTNVVTSVFVESAIMSAQHYKDLIISAKEREREIAMSHMIQVFSQIDEDNSGFVTADELEYFLEDPNLRKYVAALDINAEDARMMFRLLDRDDSMRVDIHEFCEGCIRLQGQAKAFDVHVMIFKLQLFLSRWSDFTVYVEEGFERLNTLVQQAYSPSASRAVLEGLAEGDVACSPGLASETVDGV